MADTPLFTLDAKGRSEPPEGVNKARKPILGTRDTRTRKAGTGPARGLSGPALEG